MKYQIEYWCNLNLRDKYFDGYKPLDDLVYVGTVEATGLDDAYHQFNRIDEKHSACPGNKVIDKAEAPSMSVGDVIHVVASSRKDVSDNYSPWAGPVVDIEGESLGPWLTVARVGFTVIEEPDKERLIMGRIAGEVIRAREQVPPTTESHRKGFNYE